MSFGLKRAEQWNIDTYAKLMVNPRGSEQRRHDDDV